MLIDESLLLLLQCLISLIALPPPTFQQLPLLLLLPASVGNESFNVLLADFPSEDGQFPLELLRMVVQLLHQGLLLLLEVQREDCLVLAGHLLDRHSRLQLIPDRHCHFFYSMATIDYSLAGKVVGGEGVVRGSKWLRGSKGE